MENRMKWLDREFKFDFPDDIYPMVVDRLRGAPIRLEEKLAKLSPSVLTTRPSEAWSIQQQAGHLLMLEPLWTDRLDDYLNGEESMRPADLENTLTYEADLHARSIGEILAEFRQLRGELVNRLQDMTIEQIRISAYHPRLKLTMRFIDVFHQAAEHDDHHLAVITDLIVKSG